jgi:hypothetical protein
MSRRKRRLLRTTALNYRIDGEVVSLLPAKGMVEAIMTLQGILEKLNGRL